MVEFVKKSSKSRSFFVNARFHNKNSNDWNRLLPIGGFKMKEINQWNESILNLMKKSIYVILFSLK